MGPDVEPRRGHRPGGADAGDVAGAADDVGVAGIGQAARPGRQRGVVATAEDDDVTGQAELGGDLRQDAPHRVVGLHEPRQAGGRQPGRLEHLVVPREVVSGGRVEPRDRRRGGVDGPLAREPPRQVRVRVTEHGGDLPEVRLVVADPQDAGQRRAARHGQVAGQCQEAILADPCPDGRRLLVRAAVEEEDGRAEEPCHRRPSG